MWEYNGIQTAILKLHVIQHYENKNAFKVDPTLMIYQRLFPPNIPTAYCFHTSFNASIYPYV